MLCRVLVPLTIFGILIALVNAAISQEEVKQNPERNLHYLPQAIQNAKWNRETKSFHRFFRNLKFFRIKLKNIIDNYDLKKKELDILYSGIVPCGLKNCGELSLIRRKKLKKFECGQFKNLHSLKEQASGSLLNFRIQIQSFEERFQELINFEEKSVFEKKDIPNGSRLAVLNELRKELERLRRDAEEWTKPERMIKKTEKINFQIKSLTDLEINEWRVLQQSKEYIKGYWREIKKILKCWKKIEKMPARGKKQRKNEADQKF